MTSTTNSTDEHHTTPATGESEASALARRVREGDRAAEDQTWRRYRDSVRLSLRRYARSEYDIDDWLSRTFEIGISKMRGGDINNPDALEAFLKGVARSVALSALRKEQRLSYTDDLTYIEHALVDPDTPYDAMTRAQDVEEVCEWIRELPTERDRVMVLGYYFEELSREELGRRYDLSKDQFARVFSRARTRLKSIAKERCD
ncbi:MAG: sigma-70 family RNA polymerase sigma factor [Pseudomonadota bacterium]